MRQNETLELYERTDWGKTALGLRSGWPAALKAAARLVLASPVAMAILVGRDGIMIYNDGYAVIAGKRHPHCFAASALSAWPEVADFNRAVIDRVHGGETISYESQQMSLLRNDVAEEVWLDLDYSPVVEEDGSIIAVFAVVVETTKRVTAEKDLARSREQLSLALGSSTVVGTWEWHVAEDKVYSDAKFAGLYGVEAQTAAEGAPIGAFTAAIHPDDSEQVGIALTRAMKTGNTFSMEYRLVQKNGDVRWILAEGKPVMDARGQCHRFPGISVDITEQKKTAEAHAQSEAAFRVLADAMPQMVWSTRPDGFHDYYNARWYEFTGTPPGSTDGEGWNDMFHEEDREQAWATWRHSLKTGEPYQIEYRLRHRSGEYRWVLGRALPTRDERGEIARWYGTCTDIHDAKMIQSEREVVAQELSHRIKNIFSVLGSIIALSARSKPQAAAFAEELRQRIDSMGRAHDFVRPHSKSSRPAPVETTVFGLLNRLLEPYGVAGFENRVVLTGEDAPIGDSAATPLALLIHELGTNSTKYGALSSADGTLRVNGTQDGGLYALEWKESGGPSLAETVPGDGFGSRLMRISVEGQLGGQFSREWEDDGVRVRIILPAIAIARSSRLSGL